MRMSVLCCAGFSLFFLFALYIFFGSGDPAGNRTSLVKIFCQNIFRLKGRSVLMGKLVKKEEKKKEKFMG